MKVYLVRHAESTANALNINGGAEVELSEKGLKQAGLVAKRFTGVSAELILCSRHRRAVQTAEIMGALLRKRVDYDEDLLREWRWPRELKGSGAAGPEVWEAIYAHAHDPAWHYSNEENIAEITARAKRFLNHMRSRSEEAVIVIMHGAFLSVVLGLVLFGEGITPAEVKKATSNLLTISNTGITELEITGDGAIRLITLNEYAHLSELDL